jgi:hypothetical protein
MTTTIEAPVQGRTGWVGYAAAGWAAAYATIALFWTVTGDGYPYGQGDPALGTGLLNNLPAEVGAPAFAAVLCATAVMALVMVGGARPPRPVRHLLLGFGALVAAAFLVVVPGPDLLALAGYAPLLIVGAPFGWPDVDYGELFSWSVINQLFGVVGGFLVAATVRSWQRHTREGRPAAWTTPAAAARWGRWAVSVAMAVPLIYATTRFAWLLGIPLTVTDEFVDELHATGAAWAGAWLASFAVAGAVLTLGLAQRWGERFPRWLVGLAGRRVPIMFAVAPAAVVSVLVTSAGIGFLGNLEVFERLSAGEWIYLPQLLWPVWGVALGTATFAYYLRRRGSEAHA